MNVFEPVVLLVGGQGRCAIAQEFQVPEVSLDRVSAGPGKLWLAAGIRRRATLFQLDLVTYTSVLAREVHVPLLQDFLPPLFFQLLFSLPVILHPLIKS